MLVLISLESNRIVDDLRNVSAVCVSPMAISSNYDALRDAIVHGDIAPEARLVESDISTTFEMSRGEVRTALIRLGIAPENIVAAGRGKREPAVPTADGVAEPRNRRVEILVR